jgi:hypothetical protein
MFAPRWFYHNPVNDGIERDGDVLLGFEVLGLLYSTLAWDSGVLGGLGRKCCLVYML